MENVEALNFEGQVDMAEVVVDPSVETPVEFAVDGDTPVVTPVAKPKGRVHQFRVVQFDKLYWAHNNRVGALSHDKRTAVHELKKAVCKEGETYEIINVPHFTSRKGNSETKQN